MPSNFRQIEEATQLRAGEVGVATDGNWYGRDYRGNIVRLNITTISGQVVETVGAPRPASGGSGGSLTGVKAGVLRNEGGRMKGGSTTSNVPEGGELYFTETRAAIAGYGASAVGTDAYAITVTGITALVVGDVFRVKADVANTGPATLQVNSLPAVAAALLKNYDQPLVTGDIEAGQIFDVFWDGTNWQMQGQLATAVTLHGLLSPQHNDTATATPALGDTIYGETTPQEWNRLAGNITTTKKALTQVGTGAASAVPVWEQIDHGGTTGLTDDDHTIYVLLLGRAGGQTLSGGDAANDDLTLQGTTHATRTTSYVLLQPTAGNVGIGTLTPTALQEVSGTAYPVARFRRRLSVGQPDTSAVNALLYEHTTASIADGTGPTFWFEIKGNPNPAAVTTIAAIGGVRQGADNSGALYFWTKNAGVDGMPSSPKLVILKDGKVGILTTAPTAYLHLPAGTATANTAPLKFTTGVSNTTAEVGAEEFTTDDRFFTITTGAARKRYLFAEPVGGLTPGRVPFATTNGRLTDAAGMTPDQMVTFYGASATGNDTYVITPAPALGAYAAGVKVLLKTDVLNTGACSVNVSGLGAVNIKTRAGADPGDGDLPAGSITLLVHDGTNFQMV